MDRCIEVSTLVLYCIGLAFSLLLSGRLLSGRHTLSRLLGGVMVAWAFNCASSGALLLFHVVMGCAPEWEPGAWLTNSFLLALAPITVCGWFVRENHATD